MIDVTNLKGVPMKSTLSFVLLAMLSFACAHKKPEPKEKYSPVMSYEMEGVKYESTIQIPKGMKDKVPLVIVVHEWWGRTPYIMDRARMLNEQGFAALPVDLFGNGKTVETPPEATALATPFYKNPEIGIERLNKYVELAKKDPHVDPSKIYVIGFCFGGTQALNLARSGADVKGVVSLHGGLATTVTPKEVKADVLVLHGGADPMVPKKELQAFEKEMKTVKADYRVVTYPGAKHAFTNPNATEIGKKYKIPIAYNKAADEAAWQELLKFLRQ